MKLKLENSRKRTAIYKEYFCVITTYKQYAKEELVAELTSATVGQSLGISTHIREENAMYLKNLSLIHI